MKTQYQNRNEEFFKLSAAATDEFNRVIVDVREQEFHDSIREILVSKGVCGEVGGGDLNRIENLPLISFDRWSEIKINYKNLSSA